MKSFIFLVSLVLVASTVSGQKYSVLRRDNEHSFITTAANMIVDWISKAIQYMFELFDLKIRSVRFLTSLYTTDNLILLKKFLNVGLRFGGWVYELIPNSTSEGNNRFLSFLFPQVDQGSNEEPSFNYDEETSSSTGFEEASKSERYPRNDYSTRVDNLEKKYEHQTLNLNALINSRRK